MSQEHIKNSSPSHELARFVSSFKNHPGSVGETYFGHARFAFGFAFKLFGAGGAALIHAIIPAFFETTASRLINSMHDDMMKRHPQD